MSLTVRACSEVLTESHQETGAQKLSVVQRSAQQMLSGARWVSCRLHQGVCTGGCEEHAMHKSLLTDKAVSALRSTCCVHTLRLSSRYGP